MPQAASRFCSRHRPASKPQGPSAPYATRSDIPEPSEPLQPKPPHPPHPTPPALLTLKTRPALPRSPHPFWTSSTWGRPAGCPGRPGGQPALSGWCTGPPPTRPPLVLPLCRPQRLVCGQQAQACSLLRAACLQRPLPRAVLRAADWECVGYRWIGVMEQASGAPWSRSTGPRSTPCLALAGAFGTPASSAFLRLCWPFRCRFAQVQRRLLGSRRLWIDQAWSK